MSEQWRPVVGAEDFYLVSNLGRVKSLSRQVRCYGGFRTIGERILKSSPDSDGYPLVTISFGGIQYTRPVHRLVLEAFVGPLPEGLQSLHADGVPANCSLMNLSYGTAQANWKDRERHGRGIHGSRNPHAILRNSK